MGTSIDFDAFERDFRDACLDGVRHLTLNHNEAPFYGLFIYVDGFDGAFGLYANTEADFLQTLARYQAQYPESYHKASEIRELKYNGGDAKYCSLDMGLPNELAKCMSAKIKPWSELVYDLSYNQNALTEIDYQLFDEVGCRIALSAELADAVKPLNKTKDFVVTVTGHDEPTLASIYRPRWYAEYGSLTDFDAFAYSDPDAYS